MLIYVKITDRQTDKHIKTIVRNLTKNFYSSSEFTFKNKMEPHI